MAEELNKEFSEDDDDLVVLRNAQGEDIEFVDIAGIALSHGYYAIMQPVELMEDMQDDEALVFKVERTEDGEDKFSIVFDDEIINEVFDEYYKLLDKYEASGEGDGEE